jgi:hypothetical protein
MLRQRHKALDELAAAVAAAHPDLDPAEQRLARSRARASTGIMRAGPQRRTARQGAVGRITATRATLAWPIRCAGAAASWCPAGRYGHGAR